jgi:Rho-binding antiterminator
MEPYIPINCNFYDELEALATMKRTCRIVFRHENGAVSAVQAVILDLFIINKVEYMKLDSGLEIRLDKLIEVDGKLPGNYC